MSIKRSILVTMILMMAFSLMGAPNSFAGRVVESHNKLYLEELRPLNSGTTLTVYVPTLSVPTITGDGTTTAYGMLQTAAAKTDDYTLLAADCGKAIVMSNTTTKTLTLTTTLPIGYYFDVVNVLGNALNINPADTALIMGATNAAGDMLQSTTVGDCGRMVKVAALKWMWWNGTGTWADAN